MKEEFEYGEEVLVRNDDNQDWQLRHYIDTVELGDTGEKIYCVHFKNEDQNHHSGLGTCFRQIWKIQNPLRQPEPALIDIEQPETKPLFISTQGVFTAEEVVMQLQERIEKLEAIVNGAIKHINEQFDSIKKQLK